MIKEFLKGQHTDDKDLEEDYLDWFFLHHFGKGIGYWRNLSEDKLNSILTLESEDKKAWWDTWIKIFSKLFGK